MNGISAASASYLTPSRFADVKWQIRGLADFNGDGRTDVLWHHQKTGELYVWMLNGTVTTAGSYLDPKSFSDTQLADPGHGGLQQGRQARHPLAPPEDGRPLRLVPERHRRRPRGPT